MYAIEKMCFTLNFFISQENQTRNSEGRSSLKKVKLTYEETTPVQDNMYVE